jgi:uncharacterized protein YjbI with pentapeptide repeats
MENSGKCSYEGCTEESYRKDEKGKCVFHSEYSNKSEDFEKAFWNEFAISQNLIDGKLVAIFECDIFEKSFKGAIDFSGFIFPEEFLENSEKPPFKNIIFKKEVIFDGATFLGYADFSETTFSSNASFSQIEEIDEEDYHLIATTFQGGANFSSTKFKGDALFLEAEFNKDKEVDFTLAKFTKRAIFNLARFNGHTQFKEAEFEGKADFFGVEFTGSTDFSKAKFIDTNFSGAEFTCTLTFEGVSFKGNTDFEDAIFSGDSNFNSSTFGGPANFRLVRFSEKKRIDFRGTKFKGKLIFLGSRVEAMLDFRHALISDANFKWVYFLVSPKFDLVKFTKYVDFTNAEFHQKILFNGSEEELLFSKTNEVLFREVKFHVKCSGFRHADLSHASFLYTDVKNLVFEDVKWYQKPFFIIGHRWAICDENDYKKNLKEPSKTSSADNEGSRSRIDWTKARQEAVSTIYKQLRINYERGLNFSEYAGDFHIGEMEMRAGIAWADRNIADSGLMGLYKVLSSYGERWWLALFWILLTIFGFAVLVTPVPLSGDWSNYYWDNGVYFNSLRVSALTFMQQSTPGTELFGLEFSKSWPGLAERILSFILIASLVLAINRKLSRTQTKG